ncbi:MAG: hypothetical protein O7D86_09815 [Proteobacteria bacterium]|nr:hypothetical protein [Pseudomonadota bacterium]
MKRQCTSWMLKAKPLVGIKHAAFGNNNFLIDTLVMASSTLE